ncbi:hypothetical protein K2X33_06860 [bacterium]|nr:hypothetical protein [bacterium]
MKSRTALSFLAAIGLVASVGTVAIASDDSVELTELSLVSENVATCEVCAQEEQSDEAAASEANFHHHHHHHHHHHTKDVNGGDELPSPQFQN